MHDVVEFLRAQPPFDDMDDASLQRVGQAVEIEFFPAGATVLGQGAASTVGYVVRSGAVDLLDAGAVVDHRGVGEVFGLPSMLTGDPSLWEVRAAEDLLVYRVPGDVLSPLLTAPFGFRFVLHQLRPQVRNDLGLAAPSPALRSVLRPAIVVGSSDTVSEAVRRLGDERASVVLVRREDGGLGIVTDADLRTRVLARGLGSSTLLREVMTPEALTVEPTAAVEDALLLMLERSVRHLPVVARDGTVLGVVEDIDLLAAERRAPFRLRHTISTVRDLGELENLATQIPSAIVCLYDSGVSPASVTAARSVLVEALCRRLIELDLQQSGPAPAPFAWLMLGSTGRRESVLTSDADTAMAWHETGADEHVHTWMGRVALAVVGGLDRCGIRSDDHGVVASDPRFARSFDEWHQSVQRWVGDPTAKDAVTYVCALLDGHSVWGEGAESLSSFVVTLAQKTPGFVQVMARLALGHRPPTGFLRKLVVEQSGEHRMGLDLKRAALTPVVDLARHGAVVAGSVAVETPQRLRDAAAAGVIHSEDAEALQEVFGLMTELRLQGQVEAVRAGRVPDDLLDPDQLSPLMRRHLRDCFQVVRRAQRRLEPSPWQ